VQPQVASEPEDVDVGSQGGHAHSNNGEGRRLSPRVTCC
jgi:hypothetical protein